MSKRNLWVVIPNWGTFQHYRDRRPPWIKTYTALLDDEAYLSLTLRQRAILHGLWLAYAAADGRLMAGPSAVSARLNAGTSKVRMRDLQSLSDAGFIELSASKPASISLGTRARTREREAERPSVSASTNGPGSATAAQRAAPSLPPVEPCPECGVGAGRHAADCPLARATT